MSIKALLLSLPAVLVALATFFLGWGFLGIETGIWIDGCPDVVAGYIEAHGVTPAWWIDLFFWVIPPMLFLAALFIGQLTYRFVSGRPDKSITPKPLRGSA